MIDFYPREFIKRGESEIGDGWREIPQGPVIFCGGGAFTQEVALNYFGLTSVETTVLF